ncbi:small multi-drug export protein [Candidatus Parcubacteria bacterium]|nr:small multi-drug export protein [Candidatus Parcubacteria bacterium]
MILELKTFLLAMTPIGELRASIPYALEVYDLSLWSAYFFSVIGNLVPAIFLLWLLGPISQYLSHHFYSFNRFFAWLFERNRKNHQKKFEHWKELALVILVAIPLPFTGAWTGSICAFIFRIPFKIALPLIFIGILIAGILVTLLSLGLLHFF